MHMALPGAAAAASRIRRAASSETAIGFSQITCLPCFKAAMHGSGCTGSGAQLSNTSIRGSAAIAFQSVETAS
jgi:hypothetical protein